MKLGFGVMPFRVSAASTSESTVAINDDDDPEVTVSFGASSYTVPEGGAVEVSVTLSADPERDVTIPVAKANRNGASDQDHSGIPASVAFGPGETEKKFTVNGTQDDVDDNDESVKLTFGTLPTRVTKGSMDETVVNITDDDVPFVKVDFAHGTDTVLEGYNLGIKVVLDVDPERTVTIPIVATEYDGASHHDYSVPGSVTFKSGETQAYPIFDAVHDDIDEDDERVVLTFGTPLPHRVTVGNPGMIDITITDDVVDGSPIQVSFRNGRHEVDEGESADLTVVLSKAADADLTIQLEEIHFDNIEASDYSGVPRNVQFARGDTEATFTVTAVDDSLAERTETLAIRFQNLPSIVRVGTIFGTDVVINDNDRIVQELNAGCPTNSGTRITLERTGTIGQAGESDFWSVELDPWRVYIIEVLGADSGLDVVGRDTYSGNLTLADPELVAVWNADRSSRHGTFRPAARDGGSGRNSAVTDQASGYGMHQFEVQGNGGNGTYQIKVRVNNVCTDANGYEQYPWFGGPDGYVLDIPSDSSTNRILRPHHENIGPKATGGFLGDNWDWYWNDVPDEDWIRADLQAGYEYTFDVRTDTSYPERHQATELKILGIYDSNVDEIKGTSRWLREKATARATTTSASQHGEFAAHRGLPAGYGSAGRHSRIARHHLQAARGQAGRPGPPHNHCQHTVINETDFTRSAMDNAPNAAIFTNAKRSTSKRWKLPDLAVAMIAVAAGVMLSTGHAHRPHLLAHVQLRRPLLGRPRRRQHHRISDTPARHDHPRTGRVRGPRR